MNRVRALNGYVVSLIERDQHNDYSVAYDYTLIITGRGEYRRYDCGSNPAIALQAFDLACDRLSYQA